MKKIELAKDEILWENHYKCDCGEEWNDIWSCKCDDECSKCGSTLEPYKSNKIKEND